MAPKTAVIGFIVAALLGGGANRIPEVYGPIWLVPAVSSALLLGVFMVKAQTALNRIWEHDFGAVSVQRPAIGEWIALVGLGIWFALVLYSSLGVSELQPRAMTSGGASSSLRTPGPSQVPPTRNPVVPRVNFPVGTEILVNDTTFSPPMRPEPSNKGLVESLRKGDRLVVTGDYVVNEEEFDTPQIWWPVTNPETGRTGYLMDLFVEKD